MGRLFHLFIVPLFSLFVLPGVLCASVSTVAFKSSSPVYTLQAFNITLGNTYSNYFDPAVIDVWINFTAPGGSLQKQGCFWYIPYIFVSSGDYVYQSGTPFFQCRITPFTVGTYSYTIYAKDASSTGSKSGTFAATSLTGTPKPGITKRSSIDSRYFQRTWSNGTSSTFWPLCMSMDEGRINEYLNYLPKFAANGGTAVRIWMSPWFEGYSFGVYQDNNLASLTNYNFTADVHWTLDYVFGLMESYGVTVILILFDDNDFQTDNWYSVNPFSNAFGGPLSQPSDIFTNSVAIKYCKNIVKYVVSRWGYSSSLLMWELMNEQDSVTGYLGTASVRQQSVQWNAMMSSYIKSIDPHQHLITVNFANNYLVYDWFTSVYEGTQKSSYDTVDVITTHRYAFPDTGTELWDSMHNVIVPRFSAQPVMITETGTTASTQDDSAFARNDPTGIDIKNQLWTSLMAKMGGSSLPYWYEQYIGPQNLYWRWKGIAAFIAGENLQTFGYTSQYLSVTGTTISDLVYVPQVESGDTMKAYLQNVVTLSYLGDAPSPKLISYVIWETTNADATPPPTFHVTSAVAFTFKVGVTISGGTSTAIYVDGVSVTTASLPGRDGTAPVLWVTASVSAGTHTIVVKNTGNGYFEVGSFVFTKFRSQLKCYSLTSPSRILGWVSLVNNTWTGLNNNYYLETVNAGKVQIGGISGMQNGQWNLQWWDTTQGTILSTSTVTVSGGTAQLSVPQIVPGTNKTDFAFKMWFVSATTTAATTTTHATTAAATTTHATTAATATTAAATTTHATTATTAAATTTHVAATTTSAATTAAATTTHATTASATTTTTSSSTTSSASPSCTTVSIGSSAQIVDSSGNRWTITSGGLVAKNGVADQSTGDVMELAYVAGVLWQENSDLLWWYATSTGWAPLYGYATSPLGNCATTKKEYVITDEVVNNPWIASGSGVSLTYETSPDPISGTHSTAITSSQTGAYVSFIYPGTGLDVSQQTHLRFALRVGSGWCDLTMQMGHSSVSRQAYDVGWATAYPVDNIWTFYLIELSYFELTNNMVSWVNFTYPGTGNQCLFDAVQFIKISNSYLVYDDTPTSPWQVRGARSTLAQPTSVPTPWSGTRSYEFTTTSGYGNLEFYAPSPVAAATQGKTHLQFTITTPNDDAQLIVQSSSTAWTSQTPGMWLTNYGPQPVSNIWTTYQVPLSDLGVNPNTGPLFILFVDQHTDSGHTYQIDLIEFVTITEYA